MPSLEFAEPETTLSVSALFPPNMMDYESK